MNAKDLREIKEMLLNNDLESLKKYVELEEQKNNEKKNNRSEFQKNIIEYLTHPIKTGYGNESLYGIFDEQMILTNGASIYLLKSLFEITPKIKRLAKEPLAHRALSGSNKDFEEMILKATQLLDENTKMLTSLEIATFLKRQNEKNSHLILIRRPMGNPTGVYFRKSEISYISKFLGIPDEMLISMDNPILSFKSSKGKAYILGENTRKK